MNLVRPFGILCALILAGFLNDYSAASAQQQPQGQQANYPVIRQILVSGAERVSAETISSYLTVRVGDPFDPVLIDQSLKSLFATELFDDVEILEQNGALIVRVVENPIINRLIFEGNKRIDREDFLEEVRLRPRQVFTRGKVKADVQRMLTLYQQKGRFAAVIEPKVVRQAQNRVDVVFEIQEGPKSRIGRINFIGNKKFSDGDLRDVLASKESRWWKIFTSNDTFDPDRQAYDQQLLREFYLNEGYADFRSIAAVAELTPDREDFFVTFTIEEGEIYEFGEVKVESDIRDVKSEFLQAFVGIREGDIYSRERIEQTVEGLQAIAGQLGYAFVDVRPRFDRNRANRTIGITFNVLDAPRVYVERININGNVRTLDRVVRREFRLQEGDAFNSARLDRSEARLNRLNFFRSVEIEQVQGSEPDRIVLNATVEEQSTGQLNVGAGYSSVGGVLFNTSIQQSNLLGRGQQARLGLQISGLSQEIDLSFTEPYFLGRSVSAGADVFLRRIDQRQLGGDLQQDQIGGSLRLGAAISEYWTLSTRYLLRRDTVSSQTRVETSFNSNFDDLQQPREGESDAEFALRILPFDEDLDGVITRDDFDTDGDGVLSEQEQAVFTGRFFQESIGTFTQSIVGYTLGTDTRNNLIQPTRGRAFFVSQDFAGLGGNVSYLRTRANFDQYWTPFTGWTFRASAEGGLVQGIGGQNVRVADRFFIGGPRIRGFQNAGVGPRDLSFDLTGRRGALGGTAFYIGRAELFFPLGELALESGVAASLFLDAGSVFRSQIDDLPPCAFSRKDWLAVVRDNNTEIDLGNTNCLAGDTADPRITAGLGISWQSPFGPFRIDLATIIKAQAGDDVQSLQFNVGTTF